MAGAAAMMQYYEGEVQRDLTDRIAAARADPYKAADEYLAADPQAPLARWWSVRGSSPRTERPSSRGNSGARWTASASTG